MGNSLKTNDVVIYCQVSSVRQSTDKQEEELTALAERSGFNVIKIFREIVSGIKDDRPFRKEILLLAKQKHISAILVTELSRWSSSIEDLLSTLNELMEYGVSLITLNGLQFDISTAQGKLMLTVLSDFSEFKRNLLKERGWTSAATAKARGIVLGRKKGNHYKSDKIAIQVINDLRKDMTYREVAAKYKISVSTVYFISKRFHAGYFDDLIGTEIV